MVLNLKITRERETATCLELISQGEISIANSNLYRTSGTSQLRKRVPNSDSAQGSISFLRLMRRHVLATIAQRPAHRGLISLRTYTRPTRSKTPIDANDVPINDVAATEEYRDPRPPWLFSASALLRVLLVPGRYSLSSSCCSSACLTDFCHWWF